MFDLQVEIGKILKATEGMQIAVGKKVVAFDLASPLVQIRWFKAQVQAMEAERTPKPKSR